MPRGDNSGTHTKEQSLWKGAGFNYSAIDNSTNHWYLEAGTGMGATLVMTNEKSAYTLTDMSTFMAYKGNLSLGPPPDPGRKGAPGHLRGHSREPSQAPGSQLHFSQ